MNHELPNNLKMSRKEEEEITKRLNTKAKGMAANFLKGLFFFITAPIQIYNKIKSRRKKS